MRNLKFTAVLVSLFLIGSNLPAQGYHAPGEDPNVVRYPVKEIPLAAQFVASELKEDFSPFMKNTKVAHPPMDAQSVALRAAKAEANRLYAAQNPAGSAFKETSTTSLGPIEIGQQFEGNSYDGIPNDNAMAVSAGRAVVSGHNSRIHAYNGVTGASLLSASMNAFSVGRPTHDKCDPRVVYDPVADRFIVCLLNGFSSSICEIVVAFSQTNDPSGAWNVYAVEGSPSAGNWTDFPQMAISSDELFITGNVFNDAGTTSAGSVIWEIEKADGYAGTPLTTLMRTTTYFSVHPVGGGLTMYGPHFFFIRANNESGGSNAFSIHRLTNTIAAGGVLESPVGFTSPETYFTPPDVSQKATTRKLKTNSCRIQNSYYENGMIYFVLNSAAGGRAAIYVGWFTISPFGLSFSALDGQHLYFADTDIAYPGIAYGGETGSKGNASFITYNTTSESVYPGNAASWMSGDHEFSTFKQVKTGTGSINGFENPSRWGDYSDACEVSGTTGEAYMAASYGKSGGGCGTYISQLFPALAVSNDQPDFFAEDNTLEVYPNPALGEMVYFQFKVPKLAIYNVHILDQQGRLIHTILNESLKEGEAVLRMSTAPLANGVYTVQVETEGNPAFYGKLVVTH